MDRDQALIEAVNALLEIAKGADEPRIAATEAMVRISEHMDVDPEPFRIALLGLHALR